METKNKFLATASSRAQGVCHDTLIDRFTTLPDEIAQHILSFVEFRDLTRLGAVSKRCYQFYHSTSSFFFDGCADDTNMQRKSKMMDRFDHFFCRRGNIKMKCFRIDLKLPEQLSRKLVQVMKWVDTAVRCNVEVLNLDLCVKSDEPVLGWPASIFNCESLRSLSVSCYLRSLFCRIEKIFKVPSSPCPNNLQCLDLSYVRIDEGFSKWISTSCKCIKEIKLCYVDMENLTIESSSLESFTFVDLLGYSHLCSLSITGEKLESIHIQWKFNDPGSRSLHICAPNLKYLKWVGDSVSHAKLEKLLCLEKAEIVLICKTDFFCEFHNAFEFLSSICRVKALILSDCTIKALFGEGSMAAPVFDTSYLRIHTANLNIGVVPAMVSLMRGMSNLNTLDIKSDPRFFLIEHNKESGFNSKYWKSQNLDFVNHLKEATIEVENGTNAWQFARFILENARNLKKMTIFHLPKKQHVIKKVMDSKKVSSAIIDFHQKKKSSLLDYI